MNYPKEIKAFYMRMNDDGKTVAAMDVLAPGIGEIIGGSQREERLDCLDRRLAELDLDPKHYWWYRDLRRYGTVPHAGFGLGLRADDHLRDRHGQHPRRDPVPADARQRLVLKTCHGGRRTRSADKDSPCEWRRTRTQQTCVRAARVPSSVRLSTSIGSPVSATSNISAPS